MTSSVLQRELLTFPETASELRVSEKTVRRLVSAGILPAVRVSADAIRVERAELDDWLEERRTAETTVGSGSSVEAVGLGSSVDNPAARNEDRTRARFQPLYARATPRASDGRQLKSWGE
jgi:excisionase family DNA binding protein